MKVNDAGSSNPYNSLIIQDSGELREKFVEHMQEMFEKLKRGETQPVYQIGAQAFTLEEWDKFLENFDEAQEAIRAALEEETGHPMTEPESTSITEEPEEMSLFSLAAKSTICSHPSAWYQKLTQKEKAEAIQENTLKSAEAQEAIVSSEAEGAKRKADGVAAELAEKAAIAEAAEAAVTETAEAAPVSQHAEEVSSQIPSRKSEQDLEARLALLFAE